MKITIIAPSSFGYMNFLVEALAKKPNVDVTHIDFSEFKYTYRSKAEKLKNLLKKTFLGVNIKNQYRSEQILEVVENNDKQDFIVVIRPDKLERSTLHRLKTYTNVFYAFYFDAIAKFPKKIDLIPLFDRVYSYEKEDVKAYNLYFITNFIYDTEIEQNQNTDFEVYNISSFDERYPSLEKLARYFRDQNISYKIEVRKEKTSADNLLRIIPKYKSLSEVKKSISRTNILLDIQKPKQSGLSFRVFEALGYQKKLITTNSDIVNYDFYNPDNICVVDIDDVVIPQTFLESKYVPIDSKVIDNYKLDSWIQNVFSI